MNDIYVGETKVKLQTGPNHKGLVVGIVTAESWLNGKNPERVAAHWCSLFPSWEKGLLVYVKLDSPERACTYTEFLESLYQDYPDTFGKITDAKLEEMYMTQVPFAHTVACPIEGASLDYDS